MRIRLSTCLAVLALAASAISAGAETVVRYGISMADIPLTTGQPDRGAGAYQFTAYTIYDPLVAWEMDVADRPGKLVPGLATEWKVDDADKTKWRFTLRKGVKFHDGSEFNADAVIWNLDKVLNDKAPQFDKRQSAQVKTRLPSVASYAKIDDSTVEITTKTVDSFFPYQMLWFMVSSPAQYDKLRKAWDKFASQPSGTGPFKLTKLVPHELAELTKNPDYWNKKRIPKADKIVLVPMPEALTRTNALLAGQVDLIETPARGTVAELVGAAQSERQRSDDLGEDGIKERVAIALSRIEARAGRSMARGTGLLATIGSTAPFVGLFGTVWGIMNSFIGISKSQTTNLAVVAPGIAEALLATALGLAAAIPAVVIYNHFSRRIAAYRALVGDTSAAVLRLVSRDAGKRGAR